MTAFAFVLFACVGGGWDEYLLTHFSTLVFWYFSILVLKCFIVLESINPSIISISNEELKTYLLRVLQTEQAENCCKT